jgi:tryptophan-rich sensory protein
MAVFQLIIGSVGFILIWLALQNLSGKEFHFRKYLLIALSLFGIGFSANGFHAKWVDDGDYWDLLYRPSWGVIFVALPLIWVSVEILILSKSVLLTVEEKKQKLPERLIYYGWILMIFTLIFLIIERNLYNNSIIYLVPATFALLLMSIAIYIDPFSIIPQTVGGEYLMISNRDSGLPILIHNFHQVDQSEETSQSFLFSGAMKGILTLMNEVTGRPDIPQNFGYANYDIMIEKSDNYIAYFICTNSVNAVRVILNGILEEIELMDLDPVKMHETEIQKMHTLVVEELEFAT